VLKNIFINHLLLGNGYEYFKLCTGVRLFTSILIFCYKK